MNRKIRLFYRCFLPFLFLANYSNSYAQDMMWVKQIAETGTEGASEAPYDMALDPLGNIYITGSFAGTVDFDPGPAIAYLSSNLFYNNIFIAKYDAHGNYIWAKNIGGGIGKALAVDKKGNVYLSAGTFMAKYDADGNYVWAKSFVDITINDIGLDGSDNVYITGIFGRTADFDPGLGVANLTADKGNHDIFLARYDNNGNYLWARQMESTGGSLWPQSNSIAVDVAGTIYLTGSFQGTVDFDPGVGVAHLTALNATYGGNASDIFIASYGENGDYKWAKGISGRAIEDIAYSIALDRSGSLYITGQFGDTIDFDPGPAVASFISNGDYDAFVAKYDVKGNYLWATKLGGNHYNNDRGNAITTDTAGNAWVTGYFSGTVNFDTGSGVPNLVCNDNAWEDIFIAKYNSSGSPVWAKSIGGKQRDHCRALALNSTGDLYITGTFTDSVDFDFGSGVKYLYTQKGRGSDMFILKIGKCPEVNKMTRVACDNYSFLGTNYTASGVYTRAFAAANGCDSIVELSLTIGNTSTNKVITGQYCDSFTFNHTTYRTSGVYKQQYTNASGCDSNFVLDLTINTGVAAKVVKSGKVLTAQIADSYQWFDCNRQMLIPGATEKVYTATDNGSYSVIITVGTCTDTSECVNVGQGSGIIPTRSTSNSFRVYPNPTDNDIFVTSKMPLKNASIRIINNLGQTMLHQADLHGSFFPIDGRSLPAGVYLIELQELDNRSRQIIIKR